MTTASTTAVYSSIMTFEEEGATVVTPTRPVRGTEAQRLRTLLMNLYVAGVTSYRIDMRCCAGQLDEDGLSVLGSFARMLRQQNPAAEVRIDGADAGVVESLRAYGLEGEPAVA